ncbi:MAG: alpha/beta fold hydrolase [Byssovorax sp.]
MPNQPRIGYAVLNEKARLHAPLRYLPIIIVPGIMGTRLTDAKSGELIWNPVGKPLGEGPQPFAVNNERLSQTSSELIPDETHGYDYDEDDKENEIKGIKHFYNLVGDFYAKLAKAMAVLDCGQSGEYQLKPRVYCAGYDWRLDNAKAALRLAGVVEEALRETGERKVIILGHSMGGMVSRYYCRVLGGESKVHALFLLASPTLGAPAAYTQLKHGPPGFYLKDMLQAENTRDSVTEAFQEAAMGESAIANLTNIAPEAAALTGAGAGSKALSAAKGDRLKTSIVGLLGEMFVLLSLGAGRWISRKEATYFTRQMPAIYQLLPNAAYSREHKNWMIFDPLATGHPPTGYMIIFPTLLDLASSLVGGIGNALSSASARSGDKMKDSMMAFFNPEDAERTSGRAKRNAQTLEERMASIVKAVKNDNTGVAPGKEKSFLESEADAIKQIIELYQRAQKSFIDCTNNRQVYDDIYTGLVDVVEMRAICASSLQLFYRFDEALTVNPRVEQGTSPLDLLKGLLSPILTPLGVDLAKIEGMVQDGVTSFVGAVGGALFTSGSFNPGARFEKSEADRALDAKKKKAREDRDAADKLKNKPLVYMPPNTFNAYCTTEEVEPGCMLLATDVVSNDDSNFLRMILLPYSLALALPQLAMGADHASGLASQAFGDGTVPTVSANPDPALLSRPFIVSHEIKFARHADLASAEATISWVKEKIQDLLPEFLAT